MLSFLYLQTDRLKGIYAQRTETLRTRLTREASAASDAGVEFGAGGPKVIGKLSQSEKLTSEETTTPEQMVVKLLQPVAESSFVQLIDQSEDWGFVSAGSLVTFQTKLNFCGYGASVEQIWRQFCDRPSEKLTRNDLYLSGELAGKNVEMPFRSDWFTGPNAFVFLCRGTSSYIECLAVVMGTVDSSPVMLQPVAFGYGFVSNASSPVTKD